MLTDQPRRVAKVAHAASTMAYPCRGTTTVGLVEAAKAHWQLLPPLAERPDIADPAATKAGKRVEVYQRPQYGLAVPLKMCR